jgi:hypothetical protein
MVTVKQEATEATSRSSGDQTFRHVVFELRRRGDHELGFARRGHARDPVAFPGNIDMETMIFDGHWNLLLSTP